MMQESNVFAIALLIHSATGFFLFTPEDKLGEITPQNPQVVVNETLELNCTVSDDSGVNVSMLYWEDTIEQRVPDDHVIPVGERTLLFRRNITSVNEEGLYTCKKNGTDGKEVTISSAHLHVEYEAVRDVTNFTCVIYKQKNELTCVWEIGLYHHPCDLRFNASLSVNQISLSSCPTIIKNDQCKKMSQISCTWTSNDAAIGAFEYGIYLEIWNSKYDVSSKLFQRAYNKQDITKYEPTSFINVTIQNMTNCTCANITWEGIPGLIWTSSKLTIHSEWDSKTIKHESPSILVCDLIPASNYNVMVQVKHRKGLYYSDIKQSSFSTCSAAPSREPSVFRSGFSSGTCYNTLYRNVTVYWKKIPRIHQNGKLTNYTLVYDGASVAVSAESSHGQLQIPCARNSSIFVYGCNEIGCSPNSTITIPQFKDGFAPTKLIVERLNTSEVELTWFGGEGQMEGDIVWFSAKPASFQCQNEINILLFKGNVTHTVLHQNAINSSIQDVIFGVAILDEKKVSSGIRWQDPCQYKKDSEPREIQDVSLQPGSPENSLIVSWSPHHCDISTDSNAYVHFYKIIYCQLISASDCKGIESSVPVLASTNTQYIIQNLEPEKEYGIWIQALSLTKEGPRSEMVLGRPTNNDLPSGATAGIVVASLFVFALVLAGAMFIVRNVKDKLGFDEAFPIHIPEMDNKIFTDEQSKSHQYEQAEKNLSVSGETESITVTTESFANRVLQSNGVLIRMNIMSNPVDETLNHDQIKVAKNSIKTDESASRFIEKQPKQKKELPPDYTHAVTVDQCLNENADMSDYIASPELGTNNDGYVPHTGINKSIPDDDEKRNLGTPTLNEQATNPEQNTYFNLQNILSSNDWNETASCHALQNNNNTSTETNMATWNVLSCVKENKHGYHSELPTADSVEESNNNGIIMMCSDYVPCNLQQAIEHSVPGELKSNLFSTTYPESKSTNSSTSTIGYVTHSGTRICNM